MNAFLHKHGDFHNLIVYKIAIQISVITDYFVKNFINKRSRTIDQMEQAARSCKQNIVEGSAAAITSKETEIKLTNVARASICELEEDYKDFLLFNNLTLWDRNFYRSVALRKYTSSPSFENDYRSLLPSLNVEEICNLAITLINQEKYLLDQMLATQQKQFVQHGGVREQMSRARKATFSKAANTPHDRCSPGFRNDREDQKGSEGSE